MNLYLAQIESCLHQWTFNIQQIVNTCQKATTADIIFFPANALSGGPLHDLVQHPAFEAALQRSLDQLITQLKIDVCFPQQDEQGDWQLYYIHNQQLHPLDWNKEVNILAHSFYFVHPQQTDFKPTFEVDFLLYFNNPTFDYRANINVLTPSFQETTLIHLKSHGFDGSNIFEGASYCTNGHGAIHWAQSFKNDFFKIDGNSSPYAPNMTLPIERLHTALIYAVKSFFSQKGFKKALIASSGGLDSALVQALVTQAIGSENTYAYLLPSEFSTHHSIEDALQLSKNLGNPHEIIPIKESYQQVLSTLSSHFNHEHFDFTEENLQARIRGLMMMALSNKNGGIVLNTSNKSEIAMGYSTMYGDAIGALSVIGDVYKSEAYALARYINQTQEIIPQPIIDKAPSAELRPDQKDADSLPNYDLLDGVLYKLLEEQKKSKKDFFQEEQEILDFVVQRLYNNEFKRIQFPPIIKVSTCCFFKDRLFPSIV